MGVATWFSTFCENIQVKNKDKISKRYKAITKRLNTDFWWTDSETSHSLQVGSYGRNTAINGTSDVDMVFQLPDSLHEQYNNHSGNGQSALLQAVRNSVKRTYSRTEIGADGQVIEVPFNDGITFELVPGFLNKDGGYIYPDSNDGGGWKETNPRPEIEAIRERNNVCNKNLVLLCRMMRSWKEKWSVPIGGLLIDTLAYQFIIDWEYRDKSYLYYDWLSRDFFNYMADQDPNQEYWKAPGSGQRVYIKGLFQYKAKRCRNIAFEAIESEKAGHKWSAKQSWREIFGTSFPSYQNMDSRDLIESQIRDCFGRVVYSHKTHEKCGDILLYRLKCIKLSQIVLSSLTTAGFLSAIFGEMEIAIKIGAIVSTILFCLNIYTKSSDLGALAQRHRDAAVNLWYIREKYLSLITDLRMRQGPLDNIIDRRDSLLEELYGIYSGAQSTNSSAYRKAQKALQKYEELTFSDDEIDNLLPNSLRKEKAPRSNQTHPT